MLLYILMGEKIPRLQLVGLEPATFRLTDQLFTTRPLVHTYFNLQKDDMLDSMTTATRIASVCELKYWYKNKQFGTDACIAK